ncbi:MAG: glycosyltransferase family 4 protein [Azonexus sp.]|jgi:glycosyltransferase involved in cell wall biosynthesis|nr:glycosyltransferase family 4 protein [Azonexus sp.]
MSQEPAVWFPAIRVETGTDVFTERLAEGLRQRGLRAEITWLPRRAEYAPWTVSAPQAPAWANITHVNTWLRPRFWPRHLPIMATIHHAAHHPDARVYKGVARALYHGRWIAPNERRVLRRADQVVAVSQFVADTARQTLLDVPMQVIYNGVDIEVFRPGGERGRAGKPFRLLYVGGWKKMKGVDLLAPIMRELGDGFVLRYTGGSDPVADKLQMPPNMRDLGRLSGDAAVAAAMQDADALLFPSRSEGFGLVAAEAMASGLPVIATSGSSLTEVVDDGVTGLLCPQGDAQAFASAARALATDATRYARLSEAARRRVELRFSTQAMLDGYIHAYRACLP